MPRSLVFVLLLLAVPPLVAQTNPMQPPAEEPMPAATPSEIPESPAWPSLEGGGAYVFFQEHDVTLVNGTAREYDRGKALRTNPQEQLFWFQHSGKEYVIRDPATLRELRAVFEPQMQLGRQQAALGEKQKKLEAEDVELVAQEDAQGQQQAEIGLRMSQLATEEVHLQEQGENTEAIEAEIQGLEEEQDRLGEPQAQLSIQRDALQQQISALASQQEELGRKLAQAAKDAQTRLNALVREALSKGNAKPVAPPAK